MIRQIAILLIFICNILPFAYADRVVNGYHVGDRQLQFEKTFRKDKCTGTIIYPYLSGSDPDIISIINEEIHDFAEIYSICNENNQNRFSVKYRIPVSNENNVFSILWTTYKDHKLYRIDSINFNRTNGKLLKESKIFNILTASMVKEIAKLSAGRLASGATWQDFLSHLIERDIQIYIEDEQWFIVFNPVGEYSEPHVVKIPKYFLKGDDVTNSR